ncbi:Uncharacterized protein SCF082_LOCUS16586, partial [Durusdinium trenchii]
QAAAVEGLSRDARAKRARKMVKMMAVLGVLAACMMTVVRGQFDMDKIKENLDTPIPEAALSQVSKAKPMMGMLYAQLEVEGCADKYDSMIDDVANGKAGTVRQILQMICTIGDECFIDTLEGAKKLVDNNKLMQKSVSTFLDKYGMDMDTITMGAPVMFMTICSGVADDEGEDKTEL